MPETEKGAVFGDITAADDNPTPKTVQTGPARMGYPVTHGWDACAGLGSLRGSALLDFLRTGP